MRVVPDLAPFVTAIGRIDRKTLAPDQPLAHASLKYRFKHVPETHPLSRNRPCRSFENVAWPTAVRRTNQPPVMIARGVMGDLG